MVALSRLSGVFIDDRLVSAMAGGGVSGSEELASGGMAALTILIEKVADGTTTRYYHDGARIVEESEGLLL